MPSKLNLSMLPEACKGIPEAGIKRALADLKKAGRLISHPQGIKSYWERMPAPD